MKNLTIREAAQKWYGEFNEIPQSLIDKAYPTSEGFEILVTEKECGYCGSEDIHKNKDNELYCGSCNSNDIYNKCEFPIWETMWTFKHEYDEVWAKKNLDKMKECGFWVYESKELGLFFGIDGGGYDFYDSHWIPLYKARGLKYHSE
ncbi:hypothetical protein FKN04_12620 [Bacillus glycinifermentans]|uniref:hypothetical protein n=1 Tax=Bacillus glycinifermentans TaxID=1664069 RepID=UPI001582F5B4|nr:hypothetical protein [Bacillus glycinifermentans]NUJ17419.1 hypothetical protein [Bacillus glycinifermentans]